MNKHIKHDIRILSFLSALFLIIALPTTVLLTQKQVITQENAAGPTLTFMPTPTCIMPPPCIFSHPACLPPVPVGGWCPITPTITRTPSPSPKITCAPLPTCDPRLGILCRFYPPCSAISPTPNPLSTNFSLTVYLHGVGLGGDNVNPHSIGNDKPLHPNRIVTVLVYDKNRTLITRQGMISFASESGNFIGIVDMGNLTGGLYLIKVQTDGFLQRMVSGIQQIIPKKINNIPAVSLVTGDINNDNQLDLLDYNLLIGCYGGKMNTPSCLAKPSVTSAGADINDDGVVDGGDYNLFLRELSVQSGDTGPTNSPTPTP